MRKFGRRDFSVLLFFSRENLLFFHLCVELKVGGDRILRCLEVMIFFSLLLDGVWVSISVHVLVFLGVYRSNF